MIEPGRPQRTKAGARCAEGGIDDGKCSSGVERRESSATTGRPGVMRLMGATVSSRLQVLMKEVTPQLIQSVHNGMPLLIGVIAGCCVVGSSGPMREHMRLGLRLRWVQWPCAISRSSVRCANPLLGV